MDLRSLIRRIWLRTAFWKLFSPKTTRNRLLWSCFGGVSAIFLVNLVGLIILSTRRRLVKNHPIYYITDPPIYFGDCSKANIIGYILHAIINALATGILAASNVAMQMLLSPTRSEIDRMHNRRSWLRIGYSSTGNFWHVRVGRRLVWLLMAVCSLPLNLLCV
jgi:hypothetical protein